jgi:RHS repeat-associated protein
LLYTSNTSGVVDDLKAYPDSDTLPQDPAYAHLTMWDRDLLGYAVSAHNATGTDAWSLVDPYDPCNGPFTMTAPSTYHRGPHGFDSAPPPGCTGGLFFQQRVDSITDGTEVFQGARVYSPSTATWLMPDPAMGTPMDPLTQLPYAYDNINPAMFTDPTGMDGIRWMAQVPVVSSLSCDSIMPQWACALELETEALFFLFSPPPLPPSNTWLNWDGTRTGPKGAKCTKYNATSPYGVGEQINAFDPRTTIVNINVRVTRGPSPSWATEPPASIATGWYYKTSGAGFYYQGAQPTAPWSISIWRISIPIGGGQQAPEPLPPGQVPHIDPGAALPGQGIFPCF